MLPNRRSLPSPHGISKRTMCRPTRRPFRGRLIRLGEMSEDDAQPLHRGSGGSTYTRKARATREAPRRGRSGMTQPDAREGQAGRSGVAERFVVPRKPGNSGGGKGPQFKTDARSGEGPGDWATSKRTMCRPTRLQFRGRLIRLGETSEDDAQSLHRGTGGSTYTRKARATREAPKRGQG